MSIDGFQEIEETRNVSHIRLLERASSSAGELSTNRLIASLLGFVILKGIFKIALISFLQIQKWLQIFSGTQERPLILKYYC